MGERARAEATQDAQQPLAQVPEAAAPGATRFSARGQAPAVTADGAQAKPTASERAYDGLDWPAPPLWAKDAAGATKPPSIADVRQQLNEDCYLFAAMASIATADPQSIVDMIKPNGDDTYTVTFKGPMEPTPYAGTSGALPARPASTPNVVTVAWNKGGKRDYSMEGYRALWPLIIEKAYAQLHGPDVLSFGNAGKAMARMTDKNFLVYRPAQMAPAELMHVLAEAQKAKTPMTAGMKKGAVDREAGMFPGMPGFWQQHAYSVVDVDEAGQRVKLFNPKPADKPENTHPHGTGWISIAEFKEYVSELDMVR